MTERERIQGGGGYSTSTNTHDNCITAADAWLAVRDMEEPTAHSRIAVDITRQIDAVQQYIGKYEYEIQQRSITPHTTPPGAKARDTPPHQRNNSTHTPEYHTRTTQGRRNVARVFAENIRNMTRQCLYYAALYRGTSAAVWYGIKHERSLVVVDER